MLRIGLHLRTATCAVLAALALGACGQQEAEPTEANEESSSESTGSTGSAATGTEAPAGTPDCSEIWQAGSKIPRTYKGCADEAGSYVERDVLGCSSGQRMVRYGDRFWGVLGGTVNEAGGSLDEDRDYKKSMRNCSA